MAAPALVARVAAAQATIDAFHHKMFEWGKYDCCRLAAHLLKGMGHRPNLTRFGYYRSELAATKALKRLGFDDTVDVVDALGFQRIPPASALPADLCGLRTVDRRGLSGLAVFIGQGRLLGFLDEDGLCHAFEPHGLLAGAEQIAWRCDPCPN